MIHQGVSFISGWVYVIYFKVNGISHKPTSRLYPGSNRARLWEPFRVSMIILIVTRKTIIPPTKQQNKKLKPLIRYRDIAFTSNFAYATRYTCHLVYDKFKHGSFFQRWEFTFHQICKIKKDTHLRLFNLIFNFTDIYLTF